MKAGVIVPQGWTGEYDGWEPRRAWERSLELALEAEALGFESIWAFDHFHTIPEPTDELTFESFTFLTALAARTERVRVGHIVLSNGFRNPALVAKMAGTLDVISDGRFELGIGAGWKRDEWEAYGYGFPPLRERLDALADALGVLRAMLEPGRATYEGHHARVTEAINLPKGLQRPRIPIMVGGNGPERTWRMAARYADELNVDGMSPDEVADAMPVIADRCAEVDRDPASLPISAHIWWEQADRPGRRRVDLLTGYREAGVSRVQLLVRDAADNDEALAAFADDCRAAGVELSAERAASGAGARS